MSRRLQIPKPKSTESIILFKKKAPKGAFAIFISDNQSGVSRFEPGPSRSYDSAIPPSQPQRTPEPVP